MPYSLYDTNASIIDIQQYMSKNGGNSNYRNNGMGQVDVQNAKVQFQMFERTTRNNKSTEYRDALTGFWENNTLSNIYFSQQNVQILQNGIRAGVYKMSNNQLVVAQQSEMHLKTIMRTVYLEHARHVIINDHDHNNDVTSQVSQLNKIVLDFCVPFVYKEAQFYVKYLEDQSKLVVPLEHSKQVDRDFKQLEGMPFL